MGSVSNKLSSRSPRNSQVDTQNAKSDGWVRASKESLGLRYNLGSC